MSSFGLNAKNTLDRGSKENTVRNETVLIVDDNPMMRESLRGFLESEGFIVSCCENGPEALDLTKEKRFKIVLTDFQMPEMNGDEVARQLRHQDSEAYIIGFSIASKGEAFLDAGANVFLSKEGLFHNIIPLIRNRAQVFDAP